MADVKGALVVVFSRITTPVGVPPLPVTVPVRLPETDPAVPVTEAGLSVVLVEVPDAVAVVHLLIRLATLTEPSPVARSYPVPVANAGFPLDTTTPNPPLLVLLQFVEPPAHGTEILPLVMSLKPQVVLLELPLE